MTTKRNYGMSVLVDTWAARGTAKRMCDAQNLSIHFDLEPGTAPYTTNNGAIHIEPPSMYTTKEGLNEWWAKLIHETRHNTERGLQCFDVMKEEKINSKSLHGGMFNLIEDSVVDNIDRGKYLGQDEASNWFHSELFKRNINNPNLVEQLWEAKELEEPHKVVGTTLLMDAITRQQYMPNLIGQVEDFLRTNKNLNPDLAVRLKKAIDNGWVKKLEELQADPKGHTAKDVWQFTQDYIEDVHEVPPHDPEDQQDEGEGEGGESGDGQGGTSPLEQMAQAAGHGDQPSDDGDADGEGPGKDKGDKDEANAQAVKLLFEEMERDSHEALDFRTLGRDASTVDMTLAYGDGSGRYEVSDIDHFAVIDMKGKQFVNAHGKPFTNTHYSYESFVGRNDDYYRTEDFQKDYKDFKVKDSLANEVKRHIQAETRQRIDRNRKKGKLDRNKLTKLCVPDAGRDWQERVFWKKDNKMTVDETVVSLLMDCSGSMGGEKIVAAIHAMDLIGDVCQTIGVDFEMAGFSTMGHSTHPTHFMFKPFGVKMLRSQIVENMSQVVTCMGANADGENVRYAYQRLKAQQAKRRILIVLSDGQPASRGGDIRWYTKEVTQGIEREGLVELHGIGILDNSVKEYYSSNTTLNNINELESTLLGVLKNNVLRLSR